MTKVRKIFTGKTLFSVKNPNTIFKGFILTLLVLSINVIRAEYVKVLSELAENIDKVDIGKKAPNFRALTREGKSVFLHD
ncbi:MAG: hypothetical protein LBF59_07080, partial [Prevotellaceae bacterium]|nr:hypothetical protein [Prevotellaceae bacterium]